MYYNGEGVEKSIEEAIKWWRRSAENGNSKAQVSLGAMYYDGKGVEKDMVQALMWNNLSVENGSDDGKQNQDTLEKEATPEQITEAKKLADEWIKNQSI